MGRELVSERMDVQAGEKDSVRVTVSVQSAGSASETEPRDSVAVRWLLIVTAVLLTPVSAVLARFSWTPSLFWTDTVNLAYALESFDPLHHQPQPPGYPLFVAVARLVHWFSPNAEVTFRIISVVVTIASAAVLYFLANRIISRWAGLAAVILFLLNPVFWHSRLRSPLRPWLALFSLLVAYCAWRCWKGERRFVWYGAAVLGTGAGFRPDLLAYLLPLWVMTAWTVTRSWKAIVQGTLAIAGLSAVWFGIVLYAMGGISSTVQTVTGYILEQSSRDSIIFAESARMWVRPVSRLVTWNAIALVGWIWAPILGYRKISGKSLPWKFLLVWILPGLAFQALVHIGTPGHTLFATPVLCLAGAGLVSVMGRHRNAVLAAATAVNVALFLNVVPLGSPASPQAPALEKAWISVRNSVAYGTFETSQDWLRWWDEMTDVSLRELRQFRVSDRPMAIVALNGNDTDFDYINWRVVSYYMEHEPIWVLMDNIPPGQDQRIRLVRGKNVQVTGQSSIALPASGRVLWILPQGGRFHRAIERFIPVQRGRYILYSDIPAGARAFEIEGFRFVPE